MPELEISRRRQELHALIDHIESDEIESVRDYLRARIDPLELALLAAPVDPEPMSEHERVAWTADEERRKRDEALLPADDVLRDLGFTEADLS